jgi:RNA 3'-terminal phosphate cyclase-like protein
MVLCPEDVSKVQFGKLSPFTIQYLRDIRDFFGVTFKVAVDGATNTTMMSAMGVGFGNLSKKMG